jgi:predicted secreted protein
MARQGGYGAVMKIDVTAVLTAVVHVVDFEFPELEKVLADVTAHDSPGGYSEFIASGKRTMNEFTVKVVWDRSEATHNAIQAAFDSDLPVGMSVQDPDGSEVIEFEAHVKKVGRIAEQEEGFMCEIAIQPTGLPTIDYGCGS